MNQKLLQNSFLGNYKWVIDIILKIDAAKVINNHIPAPIDTPFADFAKAGLLASKELEENTPIKLTIEPINEPTKIGTINVIIINTFPIVNIIII